MNGELKLPEQAFVNKFIAKSTFYEHVNINTRLQNEFVSKIQRITWLYKLAEETVGISKTEKVTEIQIFEIELKKQIIPEKVLKVIDKSIPYQILYRFLYKDSFAWGITLKEKKKVESYYFSEWNAPIAFNFTGIDLEKVYQKLVKAFIDGGEQIQGGFEELIRKDSSKKQLEADIAILDKKIKKEKQFNRQVEMNEVLLEKKKLLENLREE